MIQPTKIAAEILGIDKEKRIQAHTITMVEKAVTCGYIGGCIACIELIVTHTDIPQDITDILVNAINSLTLPLAIKEVK